MSEFLVLLPPAAALERLLSALPGRLPGSESIPTQRTLGRILAQDLLVVRARDVHHQVAHDERLARAGRETELARGAAQPV